jgi:hypothetical protein
MTTPESDSFDRAIAAMESANSRDPRTATLDGCEGPRELLFARRVCEWVRRLEPNASVPLLLAARGHTLERWLVPRSKYAMDRTGYHQWRDACARHHADAARRILRETGHDDDTVRKVIDLTLKASGPADRDAQVLEDADCLAFLEMKLADYLDEWEPDKAVRILRRTLRKMSPQAREIAAALPLDARARPWLEQAMGGGG